MRKWFYEIRREDSTAIKGFAIMMMLMHHVFAFPNRLVGVSYQPLLSLPGGTSVEWYVSLFGKICVPMFTVLAGFGIYRSFSRQLAQERSGDHTQTYLSFFARRLKKLYFKFWPIFLVFVPMGLILGKSVITKNPADWVKNFLLIDTSFNPEWWYLTSYAILVLLTPIVMAFFNRKRSSLYSDIVLILLGGLFVERVFLYFIGSCDPLIYLRISLAWQKLSIVLILLPMFMIGAWAAKYDIYERILNKFRGRTFARIFLGFALLVMVPILRVGWYQSNAWGLDQYDTIYGFVYVLAVALVICKMNIVKKILVVIGKQSMGIWLIHSFFCFYYFQPFSYALKYSPLVYLVVLGSSFACSWVIEFCVNFVAKKIGRAEA
ncbi:MAG: acyltransferase [Fibrobacter sp.]|nr:acyltransferase [Fibrobacter sp.]